MMTYKTSSTILYQIDYFQWVGSFPVSGTDPELISQRLDRFNSRKPAIPVQLFISVSDVKVCSANENQEILFSQSIRRLNCVIGRAERNEIAYIAREPTGHMYRRLCHLFRTKSSHQVEEIESTLESAYQTAKTLLKTSSSLSSSSSPSSPTSLSSPSSPTSLSSSSLTLLATIQQQQQQPKSLSKHSSTPVAIHQPIQQHRLSSIAPPTIIPPSSSSLSSRSSTIEQCKLHITSSVLLNRLFGCNKSRTFTDYNNKENATTITTTTATTGATTNATTTTTTTTRSKQRRRPVSAVFSQALHRLSSASIYNKRFSTTDTPQKPQRPVSICQPSSSTSVPTKIPSYQRHSVNFQHISTPQTFAQIQEEIICPIRHTQTTLSLFYDEHLTEWIYPVDEMLEKQLEKVAYFCKTANRSRIIGALLEQPEGAFVIRFSASKQKCLALSVRVPFKHNPTGVSHYLIIRNDNGFKLKGSNKYFPSIPMLVTHHSVMPEQLPCRLIFAHWGNIWKCKEMNNNYDYPPCEQDECSNEILKHNQ